ncbi:hypothetical protein N8703_02745 [Verrucomicrobia bacterium]|nr:hypothetical protein [Verrucomicrobiota bacterium]
MRALMLLLTLALLAYPLVVYFGLSRWGVSGVSCVLGVLFLIRLIIGGKTKLTHLKVIVYLSGSVGLVLVLLSAAFRQAGLILFYPVAVNVLMLLFFSGSLYQEQTVIERLARLREPEFPENGVRYTRTVTKVWCAFFMVNGAIAFITCFQALEVWTIYNGLISYLLIGMLFVSEFLTRRRIIKKYKDA